ncbi:hypothetical protein AAC387_Pa06g2119 [Persea americana]
MEVRSVEWVVIVGASWLGGVVAVRLVRCLAEYEKYWMVMMMRTCTSGWFLCAREMQGDADPERDAPGLICE